MGRAKKSDAQLKSAEKPKGTPGEVNPKSKAKCIHGRVTRYCRDCGGSALCDHGRFRYTCKDCGGQGICEHGKRRTVCVDCRGSGVCEHLRQRWSCNDCREAAWRDGDYDQDDYAQDQPQAPVPASATHIPRFRAALTTNENDAATILAQLAPSYDARFAQDDPYNAYAQQQPAADHFTQLPPPSSSGNKGKKKKTRNKLNVNWYCEHKRVKKYCRDCGGDGFCPHGRIPYTCKDCGGAGICEHGLRRSVCRLCKGSGICAHNKQKYTCTACRIGKSFCKHGKRRALCNDCGGSMLCAHQKNKGNCRLCKPEYFCEHMRKRTACNVCRAGGHCIHGRRRINCIYCDETGMCVHGIARLKCPLCQAATHAVATGDAQDVNGDWPPGAYPAGTRQSTRTETTEGTGGDVSMDELPPLKRPGGVAVGAETDEEVLLQRQAYVNQTTFDHETQMLGAVCRHGKEARECSKCGDNTVCKHGRETRMCKSCTELCEHANERAKCMACRLSHICEHDNVRHYCRECHGRGYCDHGKKLQQCRLCGAGTLCPHSEIKARCGECAPQNFCMHGKRRGKCDVCNEIPEVEIEPIFIDTTAGVLDAANEEMSMAGCVRKRRITILEWVDEEPASEERLLNEWADWQATLCMS